MDVINNSHCKGAILFLSPNYLKSEAAEKEIEYCNQFENKEEHFCGFFCVKEAFVKALDDTAIHYSQIEVLHNENGKPYINVTPYINSILREHFKSRVERRRVKIFAWVTCYVCIVLQTAGLLITFCGLNL